MTSLRPYLKFLIAGGVVCAEGGSLLPAGLEFFFLIGGLQSNVLRSFAIAFTVIGSVSLCIGLSLLYKGVKERNLWLQIHQGNIRRASTDLDEEESLERPMIQEKEPGTKPRRYCSKCGTPMPDMPHIQYCPKCGEDFY